MSRCIITLSLVIAFYAQISHSADDYKSVNGFSNWETAIRDPSNQRLEWNKSPQSVLVIKRINDVNVLPSFLELVQWLLKEKGMIVFVEEAVKDDEILREDNKYLAIQNELMYFKSGQDDLTGRIDLAICLGGDGTLLFTSQIFQKSVPPIMAFHFGNAGIIIPFNFENFKEKVTNVLEGNSTVTLRSRLECIVIRKNKQTGNSVVESTMMVLNEVLVDRGLSPLMPKIHVSVGGNPITTIHADGFLVSTPTGSTAYAVSAGSSLVHPSMSAILLTAICSLTFTYKPVIIHAGFDVEISVPLESHQSARMTFDGRNALDLFPGDSLKVRTSKYPVPTISSKNQISEWFDSLTEQMHWNIQNQSKSSL